MNLFQDNQLDSMIEVYFLHTNFLLVFQDSVLTIFGSFYSFVFAYRARLLLCVSMPIMSLMIIKRQYIQI